MGKLGRNAAGLTEVKIKKGSEIPASFISAAEQYTLAFFLMFETAGGGEYRSIMRYGEPNARLSIVVSHTDNPDFSCDPDPQVPVGKWTYVAVTVDKNSIRVFYDGDEVCHEQSDTGTALVTPDLHMLVGDQFHSAAFAKIDKVTYYKSEVMNSGMLKAIMTIDPPLVDKDDATLI